LMFSSWKAKTTYDRNNELSKNGQNICRADFI
jgi:hypothetical protein